jgi:hypothetical protein
MVNIKNRLQGNHQDINSGYFWGAKTRVINSTSQLSIMGICSFDNREQRKQTPCLTCNTVCTYLQKMHQSTVFFHFAKLKVIKPLSSDKKKQREI